MNPVFNLKCILAMVLFLLFFGACISKLNAEELYTYKVSGVNQHTGLRVVGQVWEQDKEGHFLAKVWDEFSIQDQCNGTWVAYGVIQVGCENGYQYVLEVVE